MPRRVLVLRTDPDARRWLLKGTLREICPRSDAAAHGFLIARLDRQGLRDNGGQLDVTRLVIRQTYPHAWHS